MTEVDAPVWTGDRGGHLWPKDREAVTDDGVRIRYTIRGPEDQPCIVLCSGYLCPDNFWTYLAPALADRYRVLLLNYRGVGASTLPRDPGVLGGNLRTEEFSMQRLAGDVVTVLDAEGVDEAVLVGHSMGVQVALEVYRRSPGQVQALILVTGPYESPMGTFYGSDLMTRLFPIIYAAGRLTPEPLWRLVPRAARLPFALDVAQLVRAISDETPRLPMHDYLAHFARLDAGVALRVAKAMHDHSAADLLPHIDVPTLAIVGGRDTFSPPVIGEVMRDEIPDCELVTIDEGTHCALLEFPGEVDAVVFDFIDRRVVGRPEASARA